MSEEESKQIESEEEVDDLFGDEEKQEVEQDSENESHTEDEEELKTIDISIPRHSILNKSEEDTYVVKMPVFLNVEAHPFDPHEFKEQVRHNAEARTQSLMNDKQKKNELVAEKLINENSIRWRYSNSGNDEIIKQSNTHFVQWDDGSISLKVGSELFDFKTLPLTDQFLVRTHDQYEILQNDSTLNKAANLLPSSTFTSTHRKLTEALKHSQKKDTILNTVTDNDPLMKQRLADENERKSLKLKRQYEQKRRLQEERLERNSPGIGKFEPTYETFERNYNDEYDEEDDFVANDDDELEEEEDDDGFDEEEEFDKGAERLRKLKAEGDSKYREDEESKRKKRRIIEDDEDDE